MELWIIPLLLGGLFAVSMYFLIRMIRSKEAAPKKHYRIGFIISFSIWLLLVSGVVTLLILFTIALSHM